MRKGKGNLEDPNKVMHVQTMMEIELYQELRKYLIDVRLPMRCIIELAVAEYLDAVKADGKRRAGIVRTRILEAYERDWRTDPY